MDTLKKYLEKKTSLALDFDAPVSPDLKYIVIIPCYNEDKLHLTLQSLKKADSPGKAVEVIIVINSSKSAPQEIVKQNSENYRLIKKWAEANNNEKIVFHPVYLENLNDKEAGAGLARKIGMDTGLKRFIQAGKEDGFLISLDADCSVQQNYFTAIEKATSDNEKLNAGILRFEHPLEGDEYKPAHYRAAGLYELFLRYYNLGLYYAGFPYPFHTIGSAFFVKALAYAKQGGMNKRKAGEDFYFLNKIFQLGNIREVNDTCVYPSPRPSDRVLFGTGPVVRKLSEDQTLVYKVYNPGYFMDLKTFFEQSLTEFFMADTDQFENLVHKLTPELQAFLTKINFKKELTRLNTNCSKESTFRKQFFHWFNGLKIIQFMHYVHPGEKDKVEITKAANTLLNYLGIPFQSNDAKDLLKKYREIERHEIQASV
jgi:glycosyltransferase involved in cell wall biosynthesis